MKSTAIFVLYHKRAPLFSSDIYHPLQTGATLSSEDLGLLRDNDGDDNISMKNPNYGELSGWYWVWKNFLPAHPEITRVGFCHYRRFLDPFRAPRGCFPFHPEKTESFKRRFRQWDDEAVERVFQMADIVVPKPRNLRKSPLYDRRHETIYTHCSTSHPKPDLDALLEQLSMDSRESWQAVYEVFNGHCFRDCLTFVMRRDLFEDLAAWMFRHLFALERKCHWERYQDYQTIRTPAYLAERTINVWYRLHPEATILERDSVQLVSRLPTFWDNLRLRLRRFRHPVRDARTVCVPALLTDCLL